MQNAAQGYLVYELTHSEAYLGYVGAAAGLPSWLFMLYGGVIADRFPRRRLMMITQTSMLILALILAALTFSNTVRAIHILILAFALGIANAFDAPARLALVPQLVEKEDLTNAIALNGTMFNLATITGPALGGLVYAAFGPGWCFLINGMSFVAVIAALSLMKLANPSDQPARAPTLPAIKEGLKYALTSNTIRSLLVIVGLSTVLGFAFINLLPAWAVDVLRGNATTNGLLRSAQGVGALTGALSLASMGRFNFRGKVLTAGLFFFPIMLLMFSFITNQNVAYITIALVGGSVILVNNLANSLIQANTPDELRGRVSSIFSLTFFGAMPIGSLLLGGIAELYNPALAVRLSASVLLVGAFVITLIAPQVRKLE